MLRAHEVRALTVADRSARLTELRRELMQERGVQAMGGSTPSPGKIRALRREISRILTIQNEDRLGIQRVESAPAARVKKESKK
ncbi:MAG: 50S ribosomal protein L29 [Thermoplasmatota archaeon]